MPEGSMFATIRKIEGEWVLVKVFLTGREGWTRADETGTRDQALAKANEALNRNPDDVTWLVCRGWMTMGPTYDRALVDIERAIRLDPKRPMAILGRAYIRSVRDQVDLAMADHDQAIALDPGDARCYYYRAQTRDATGDLDGAMADYGEAIRLNPADMLTYSARARLWVRKGMPAREMAEYDEAIRRNPGLALPLTHRSNAWLGRKDFVRALADAEEAVRLEPDFFGGYNAEAAVYRAMNDREKEVVALTAAIERGDWALQGAYRLRARAYVALGQDARAVEDFTEVIRQNPKYAQNYLDRGLVLQKMNLVEAIADYDEAIRLNPKLAPAYRNRGECWKAKGDLVKAEADFAEAARLGPKTYGRSVEK